MLLSDPQAKYNRKICELLKQDIARSGLTYAQVAENSGTGINSYTLYNHLNYRQNATPFIILVVYEGTGRKSAVVLEELCSWLGYYPIPTNTTRCLRKPGGARRLRKLAIDTLALAEKIDGSESEISGGSLKAVADLIDEIYRDVIAWREETKGAKSNSLFLRKSTNETRAV